MKRTAKTRPPRRARSTARRLRLGAVDGVYLAMETEGSPGFLNLDEGACGDDDLGGGTHLMKLQPPGAPGENSSCQWVTSVIEH